MADSDCDCQYVPHAPRTLVPTRGCHARLSLGENTLSSVCDTWSRRTPSSAVSDVASWMRGAAYSVMRDPLGDAVTAVVSHVGWTVRVTGSNTSSRTALK